MELLPNGPAVCSPRAGTSSRICRQDFLRHKYDTGRPQVDAVIVAKALINMARLERFELPTLGTGIRCSIRAELQARERTLNDKKE